LVECIQIKAPDYVRLIIFLWQTGFTLLIENYQIMYGNVKKKRCEKRLSAANTSKRIHVFRYAVRNQIRLIISMLLISISIAPVIDTCIGFPFSWFIIAQVNLAWQDPIGFK
jgi:hypothetical protein